MAVISPLKEIRWGIIGVGDVCEVKSAPAMQQIPHSRLVAVMRRNGTKAADYARRHKVPKWYDNADHLIADPEVNAIYIATPPYAHAEYTLKAVAAGKPVYVEKPMARTYEECQQMIAASQEANVPLWVAYYRRALPNFTKVKEIIDSGIIGKVRVVNIQLVKPLEPDLIANSEHNWRVDPEIAGGGYFFDLASHQLDFLDFALGPLRSVNGLARNQGGAYPAEDIVVASFEFENGAVGNGIWCFTAAEVAAKELITIIGSEGQIRFATFGDPRVFLDTDSGTKEIFEFTLPKHIQYPLLETVVAQLRGSGICPSTGQSAARTNWVMDQILKK